MRLDDTLRDVSRHRWRIQSRLTAAYTILSRGIMADTGASIEDIVTAQLNSLVSTVQAYAPPGEWGEVGAMLATNLRQRLTITGER